MKAFEHQRSDAAPGPRIVVLRSSNQPIFDAPLRSFLKETTGDLWVLPSVADRDPELIGEVTRSLNPALVVAFGSAAAMIARDHIKTAPVLFVMVLNYRRAGLAGLDGVAGIALETPPAVEFAQFKMVLPSLRRVVCFYHAPSSQELVDRSVEALAKLQVELVPVAIDTPDAIASAYAGAVSAGTAVWYLNDPVLINAKTFAWLRDRTLADKIPLLASLSDDFAAKGALMSVSVDFTSLGAQAALAARRMLVQREPTKAIGVQDPIGATLSLNLDVARQIGIDVPAEIIPFITKLIVAQSSPR
ncbi:MAG: hypothetical protein IT381_23590 [Deltaproteobacteria bacterium]|nr:hypothetical protein [Deltaproteobacteria bacterium]